MIHEWYDINGLKTYCSSGERTIRDWLKMGLRHSRVNGTGKILVKREWIDGFLEQFSMTQQDEAERLTGLIMNEFDAAMADKH